MVNVSQASLSAARLPPLGLLIGVSAMGPIVLNGVLPANSAIVAELSTRYSTVQLVVTVFLVSTFFGQIVLGNTADRYGRRPTMIFSLIVFAIGGFLCALSNSIEMLLVSRFIQGFGASACAFLPRTIVRDIFDKDRAASMIGYLTTAMMVAPLFGPAMGGWVTDNFSWRWLYGSLGAVAMLFAFLSWRFQNETLVRSKDSTHAISLFAAAGSLLRLRAFVSVAAMMAGTVGLYYCFITGAPYVMMESRGYSASVFGAWFGVVAIGYLSGNLIAGRFSVLFGVNKMIRLGMIPGMAGLCLLWLFSSWHHPLGLFLPMSMIALSNGMSLPNMTSAAMSVRPDLISSASGLAGAIQTGFGVLITLVLGVLLPLSDLWLFGLMSLSAMVWVGGIYMQANNADPSDSKKPAR